MKEETKHTPEPWVVSAAGYGDWKFEGGFNGTIVGKDKQVVFAGPSSFKALRGETEEQATANAKRIVACVNACAGISNEDLESGGAGFWGRFAARNARRCDELAKVMLECAELIDRLYPLDQKTATQIRNDLREAVAKIQPA